MNKIWILTRRINAYEQDGSYFVTAFIEKPTVLELINLFYEDMSIEDFISESERVQFISHILNGGGRQDYEHEWYYLSCVEEGKKYGD
jgi:hypothetical protein